MNATSTTHDVVIVGAGLVGSLLALGLKRRGFDVAIYERRPDPRATGAIGGRSINLALSDRGLLGLAAAGVSDEVEAVAVPMPGRCMHATSGATSFMPYGLNGEAIRSVSRGGLNLRLIELCASRGVQLSFAQRCEDVDLARAHATFRSADGTATTAGGAVLVGADGTFSAVRQAFLRSDRFDYRQDYLEHGYKELTIPPGPGGAFLLEKHALHIWPRQSFMLIALPNLDGSFTCTLFLAFDPKGEDDASFANLRSPAAAKAFFRQHFSDALALMPDFDEQWAHNPVSSLCTVRCTPWRRGDAVLIGDAAHAIVPFFGQGMNAGFEDCRVLFDAIDATAAGPGDVAALKAALPSWERARKPNADAIADLALENFVEMRDKVGSPAFLRRKAIEAALARACPADVTPAYTMVTFRPQLGYHEALVRSRALDRVLDDLVVDEAVGRFIDGDAAAEAGAKAAFSAAAAALRGAR